MNSSRDLVAAVAAGDRRALARAITVVEEDRPGAPEILTGCFQSAFPAYRVGVTGSPGAGKSTLTDGLIRSARDRDESVGILAVDPTSPFSGGAVLGDRVRMQDHVLDEGVYVRSMASRGHLGGLSEAAPKALVVMEAAGFEQIIIETVGVGQDEVEITGAADTVLVVLTPGWGDGVQAAKAGILEIGDVFVVNKSDRDGVADTVADLRSMLAMGESDWEPPIVKTVASRREGIAEVWEAIEAHRAHLGEEGVAAGRRRRRRAELTTALAATLRQRALELVDRADAAGDLVAAVERGDIDPWQAARELVNG